LTSLFFASGIRLLKAEIQFVVAKILPFPCLNPLKSHGIPLKSIENLRFFGQLLPVVLHVGSRLKGEVLELRQKCQAGGTKDWWCRTGVTYAVGDLMNIQWVSAGFHRDSMGFNVIY
jgi:hypothetical protein